MITQKKHLRKINPQQLDSFLSKGWFRMGQNMFITHFLQLEMRFHTAICLRYKLDENAGTVIQKKLKPLQKKFTIDFQDWRYNMEQELLYGIYVADSGLNIKADLLGLMMGWEEENIFDTRQVAIYDGMRLVAAGLSDFGQKTAAGICSFYHPDYRKYSLGKGLMYAKMKACIEVGMTHFYPGYAVPGYDRFNYKLDMLPLNTEYFDPVSKNWIPYIPGSALPDLLDEMHQGLQVLQQKLKQLHIQSTLLYYTYFDSVLVDAFSQVELNQPVFLYIELLPVMNIGMIVLFDLNNNQYKVALCNALALDSFFEHEHRKINSQLIEIFKSLGTFEDPVMVADSIRLLLGNVTDLEKQIFE